MLPINCIEYECYENYMRIEWEYNSVCTRTVQFLLSLFFYFLWRFPHYCVVGEGFEYAKSLACSNIYSRFLSNSECRVVRFQRYWEFRKKCVLVLLIVEWGHTLINTWLCGMYHPPLSLKGFLFRILVGYIIFSWLTPPISKHVICSWFSNHYQ